MTAPQYVTSTDGRDPDVDDGVRVHPLGGFFPPMSPDEYAALVEDIRTHGQRSPIITFHGAIVDGVHRARACRALGITPTTQEFADAEAELLAYVVSMNLRRRHLDETQRAMVAEKIATRGPGGDQSTPPIGEMPRQEAAKLLNVGTRSIDRARQVRKRGSPELIQAAERGEVSVHRAAAVLDRPKEMQLKAAKAPRRRRNKAQVKAPTLPELRRFACKRQGRAQRWAEATGRAEAALEELVELQSAYQEWRDNLPENLASSPVGEKLDAVCDLDLQGALDAVQEAGGLDLPLGFGRD